MQSERVVIVTGGSSGIGRAAALRFARQGDKVLVTGRQLASLRCGKGDGCRGRALLRSRLGYCPRMTQRRWSVLPAPAQA
jgi:NAD(P)-dependent dehydrogenase (short-subunit alcohol dehydrogenase family)